MSKILLGDADSFEKRAAAGIGFEGGFVDKWLAMNPCADRSALDHFPNPVNVSADCLLDFSNGFRLPRYDRHARRRPVF